MRFMFIVKTDNKAPPPPELMEAMHAFARSEIEAGRMIADGGLEPRNEGKELRLAGGKLIVMDGPFAETKEVIGGFAIFELPDREAALEMGTKFMRLHQDFMPAFEGTLEVRQVAGSLSEEIRRGA